MGEQFGLHFEAMCHEPHTIEFMFHKKHAPHLHAHKPRHTHAHHAHTLDFMYANVYTCTHYGRTGHLTKFCYDRIHIQILQINLFELGKVLTPMDPTKSGYQKPPLLYLMQMWALTRRESIGVLMVDVFRGKRSYLWMHHFQGKFGGRTTMV